VFDHCEQAREVAFDLTGALKNGSIGRVSRSVPVNRVLNPLPLS